MYFNKKFVGTVLQPKYVWRASKKGYVITIYQDETDYMFWFDIVKDKGTVFNSSENSMKYKSLDEASRIAEQWFYEKILEHKPKWKKLREGRKPRISKEKKYSVLFNSVKNICEKYPESPIVTELKEALENFIQL